MSQRKSKAIKRLQKEHNKLNKYNLPNAKAHPTNNMLQWIAKIKGPEGFLYANTIFNVKITFSENYPMRAPKLQFETKIDHPAIEPSDGAVCSEIIDTDWAPTLNIFYILETLVGLLATRYSFKKLRERGYYRALFMIKTFLGGNNVLTNDIPPLVLHIIVNYFFVHPKSYSVKHSLSPSLKSNRNIKRLKILDKINFYEHVLFCAQKLKASPFGYKMMGCEMTQTILACNINGQRIMEEYTKDNNENFIRNDLKCKNILFVMYISDQIDNDLNRKGLRTYSVKEFVTYVENASCKFPADMMKTYSYDAKIYIQKQDEEIIEFFSRHCGYTYGTAYALMELIDVC